LSFIKLEEVFEIHTKMAVDAEATEPATTALALGIGVTRTIGSGADEKASELPRRVLDLARDPISRPAFASLQLLGRLRWCRCVMVRAPMARSSQFQVEFLPQFSVYDKRQRRVSRILHFLFALSFLLSPKNTLSSDDSVALRPIHSLAKLQSFNATIRSSTSPHRSDERMRRRRGQMKRPKTRRGRRRRRREDHQDCRVEATTIPGRNSKNPPTSFFLSVCEPSSGEADLQQPPPHPDHHHRVHSPEMKWRELSCSIIITTSQQTWKQQQKTHLQIDERRRSSRRCCICAQTMKTMEDEDEDDMQLQCTGSSCIGTRFCKLLGCSIHRLHCSSSSFLPSSSSLGLACLHASTGCRVVIHMQLSCCKN